MPVRRRVGAAFAAMVVVAAGVASCGSRVPAAAPAPGHLAWSACTGGRGPAGAQCATLTVPLDTTAAQGSDGPTVELALDRIPANGSRIGSLIINPGGPGVSAVDNLPAVAGLLTPGVRDHFDLIGYDPPGVGHSTAVSCLGPRSLSAYLHLDPAPPGPAGFARVTAEARSFAAACQARSGALLDHVSTLDAARDLDRVRAAVGDPTLNFLGFSYGTLLGATYASLYPTRVRSMVLDGALDPTLATLPKLDVQAAAVDAQFRLFASACRASKACPWHAGSHPTATFLALLAKVRASPVAAGGQVAGPAELLYGTAEALYSTSLWPTLQTALAQLDAGNGAPIVSLFDRYMGRNSDGTFSTISEAESAVNCADTAPPTLSAIRANAASVIAEAPIFGPLNVDGEAVCALWPSPGTASPHPLVATGSPTIVVVGSTGDPITPYAWAVHLAAQLGTGRLLTRVGDGHTAYGASACVRAAVQTYLVDLRAPAPGTRCPSS